MISDSFLNFESRNEFVIDVNELKYWQRIAEKTTQSARIFNKLYAKRKRLYRIALGEKNQNIKAGAIDSLRIINSREKRVFFIVKEQAALLHPQLQRCQVFTKSQASLQLIYRYFNEMMASQERFLAEEEKFLNHGINVNEFKQQASQYFTSLEKFTKEITSEFPNFYSPKEFEAFVRRNKKALGAKYADLLGECAVFVSYFVFCDAFDSLPFQFSNVNRLPDISILAEFILIAFMLNALSIPARTWMTIKRSAGKIINHLH